MRKTFLAIILGALMLVLVPVSASADTGSRIIGGSPVAHSQYPYMASIVYRGDPSAYWGHSCGGTLIHPRWVLTAAHCLVGVNARSTDVVLGRSDLRKRNGERIAVAGAWQHPSYSYTQQTMAYDIALLYLRKASRSATPISIADVPANAATLKVSGWGLSKYNRPSNLQAATVQRMSDSYCQSMFGTFFHQPSIFCTRSMNGFSEPITDICIGDSGGPAVYEGKVVGVVSYTRSCTGLSAFARPFVALDWIRQKMANPPAIKPGSAYQAGKEYPSPDPPPSSDVFIQSTEMENRPGTYAQYLSFQANMAMSSFQARIISGANEVCIRQTDRTDVCYGKNQYFPLTSWAGRIFWHASGFTQAPCPVYQFRYVHKGKAYTDRFAPCNPHAY